MTRTEAQKAASRKRCLNGVCRMTRQEERERRNMLHRKRNESEFHRQLEAAYFRKRRAKPEIHERTNAQARARYHAQIEKSRAYCRDKYARLMADPERRAALNARRRARRKRTNAARRDKIRNRLIPLWERVVQDGRDQAYCNRSTPENVRLFNLWKNNPTFFFQMLDAKSVGKK